MQEEIHEGDGAIPMGSRACSALMRDTQWCRKLLTDGGDAVSRLRGGWLVCICWQQTGWEIERMTKVGDRSIYQLQYARAGRSGKGLGEQVPNTVINNNQGGTVMYG